MAKDNNLTDFLTDVADAIREKKGTTDLINPQNFAEEIASIETGGGEGASAFKDCNFFDPYGNIIYSFTAEEAMALTELPPAPDYTAQGLMFESYTHSLDEIHNAGGVLDIGCYYYTDDNSVRCYVTIMSSTSVILRFVAPVVVDWGDGEVSDNYTKELTNSNGSIVGYQYTHLYSKGNYIVKISSKSTVQLGVIRDFNYSGSTNFIEPKECLTRIDCPQDNFKFNYGSAKNFPNLEVIYHPNKDLWDSYSDNYFYNCNLKFAIIKNTSEGINIFAFNPLRAMVALGENKYLYRRIEGLVLDDICLSNQFDNFYYSSNAIYVKKIRIPKNLKWSSKQKEGVFGTNNYAFFNVREIGALTDAFRGVYINVPAVKTIKFDSSISRIDGSRFISSIQTLDISEAQTVVPLTSLFSIVNFEILVKTELLEEYKAATNWSNYAECLRGV